MDRKLQRTIYLVNHRLDPWKFSSQLCSSCTVSILYDCVFYGNFKPSDIATVAGLTQSELSLLGKAEKSK